MIDLMEGGLDEFVTCEIDFLAINSIDGHSLGNWLRETNSESRRREIHSLTSGSFEASMEVTKEFFAASWQSRRNGRFNSGWKIDARVQHLGRFNQLLMNLVAFCWILRRDSFKQIY